MRIGIMLRAYDRPGGIGIYSRNIVKHLLQIDRNNHYVLIYNDKGHIGTYGHLTNVDEVCIPAANPLIWDQWSIPRAVKKWGIDLIFHTKFTVPLATKAKTVMALHGASWFVHPEIYGKLDVFYVRRSMRFYCSKADFLISNSDLTTRDHIQILNVPPDKIKTVYFAAGDEFRPISDVGYLEQIRKKYRLPKRFILTVSSYDPNKNIGTLFQAFSRCFANIDVHLVIAGQDCAKFSQDFDLESLGLQDLVHFPGWVDQKDLAALYSLADVYVFPSIYETFGIPILEAMACGCPVIASTAGALPELAGDAALLVDPHDSEALANNIRQVITSDKLARRYRAAGLDRAREFTWLETAKQTLQIFQDTCAK